MIRPGYALKLANTKLRSRRGMLAASVVIASLLFAVLIAMVIVFSGAKRSATELIKKAGNDRYLVHVRPNIPHQEIFLRFRVSLDELRYIRSYERQYRATLAEKYRSLGLAYNDSVVEPALEPDSLADPTTPQEQRFRVNFRSPIIQEIDSQRLAEYAKTAPNTITSLRRIGDRYGATGYYIAKRASFLPNIPRLRLIQHGKESFDNAEVRGVDSYGYFTNAIHNGAYSFVSQELLSRYILPTDPSKLQGIPVVVSAQEAAALFGNAVGIGPEPESSTEKVEWLKAVQTKLQGHTYQVCYRNTTEQAMLEKIQRDYAEAKNNERNKSYVKPSVTYAYPETPCGPIAIREDSRTHAQRQAEQKQHEANKSLGVAQDPYHQLITFQIVGFRYAQPFLDHTKDIYQYTKSLLTADEGMPDASIPIQLYDKLPTHLKINFIQQSEQPTGTQRIAASDDFVSRVLEFTSAQDARSFLENETCPEQQDNCNKKFIARQHGSNYLILDDISTLFNKIAIIAFPAIFLLAMVIMWLTISRIMADNRKETAVYRAMGARRKDIAVIYLLYVFRVACRIVLIASLTGALAALLVNHVYTSRISESAVAAFGIIDRAPDLSLFAIDLPTLIVIVISILLISLIASIQPLVRNVLRNPIRDMQDE